MWTWSDAPAARAGGRVRGASIAGVLVLATSGALAAPEGFEPVAERPRAASDAAHGALTRLAAARPDLARKLAADSAVLHAVSATFIHGMPADVARACATPAQMALLRNLLAAPEWSRRASVVAVLWHVGGDDDVAAIASLLAHSPAQAWTPEEDRAFLTTPRALGMIAGRGSNGALELLLGLVSPESGAIVGPLPEGGLDRASALRDVQLAAIRGLALSGHDRAIDRLEAVARGETLSAPWAVREATQALASLGGEAAPIGASGAHVKSLSGAAGEGTSSVGGEFHPTGGRERPVLPTAVDTATSSHEIALSYANHIDLHPALVLTDLRVDQFLDSASWSLGSEDFPEDVACCTRFVRYGTGTTFGTPGDGLDVIDRDDFTEARFGPHRVTVVRQINWCGEPVTECKGCAMEPGRSIVVVRMSDVELEGLLWAHEYGHNAGRPHHADLRYVMYGGSSGAFGTALEPGDCDALHSPPPETAMSPVDVGPCEDADGDGLPDVVDPCPTSATTDDFDFDGTPDPCDSCPGDWSSDHEDFDGDLLGDACDPDCPCDAATLRTRLDGGSLTLLLGADCPTRNIFGGTSPCSLRRFLTGARGTVPVPPMGSPLACYAVNCSTSRPEDVPTSNMAFRLERSLPARGGARNFYLVAWPTLSGLADVGGTGPSALACDDTAGFTPDGVIDAVDAACHLWDGAAESALAFSRWDAAVQAWVGVTVSDRATVRRVTGTSFALQPGEGYRVQVSGGASNDTLLVGAHDPGFTGVPVVGPPAAGREGKNVIALSYHAWALTADEILCGPDLDADGRPDDCGQGLGAFDGVHECTVLTFDNTRGSGLWVGRTVSRDASGTLRFTGSNFALRPGEAYVVVTQPGHAPTLVYSPHC